MEKVLTIYVNCTEMHEVQSDAVTVRQVLFDGYAEGEAFRGKILPGGVDTQTIPVDGDGMLCARYMLEGRDSEGKDCQLYIENTATLGGEITHPRFVSDSKVLSQLAKEKLQGRMISDEQGFRIEICAGE